MQIHSIRAKIQNNREKVSIRIIKIKKYSIAKRIDR